MIFTIEINDEQQLAAISLARQAYNENLPIDSEIIETDSDYIQFVMGKAAESYVKQYIK
jgi:hypothetical protein